MPVRRPFGPALRAGLVASLLAAALAPLRAQTPGAVRPAPEALPPGAQAVGAPAPGQRLRFSLTLPLRHADQLDSLLARQYAPGDPLFHQFLTPDQFAARFAPTQAEYDAALAAARSQGLTVTHTAPNRTLIGVSAPVQTVETLFHPRLAQFRAPGLSRAFYAPTAAPVLPAALAGRVAGVAGLSDAPLRPRSRRVRLRGQVAPRPFGRTRTVSPVSSQSGATPTPLQAANNGSGLGPGDIQTAYGLSHVPLDGQGQTLALFESDGYDAGDIRQFVAAYIPDTALNLVNRLVDGATGAPQTKDGEGEVELDIEMALAMAPGLSSVVVYMTPDDTSDALDGYNAIANETQYRASQVSTSWGFPASDTGTANAIHQVFQQMASQGQAVFAAAGDNGAYDDGRTVSVDFPAEDPNVTAVGGTSLSVNGDSTWASETTWDDPSDTAGSPLGAGGGGGVSSNYGLPSYQQGVPTASGSGFSTSGRNLPDVSLDADPNTGYSVYVAGSWELDGGTSATAPLWAGLTALVNERRAALGQGALGFANPALYAVGKNSSEYARDFHDIADGSTNLYYRALSGYDLATGLGTPQGAALIADLAPGPNPTWLPGALAVAPDNTTRLFWTQAHGPTALWDLDTAGRFLSNVQFGPYTGWTPLNLRVGADGATRMLWADTGGTASLWDVSPGGQFLGQQQYGPYTGWYVTSLTTAPDGTTRLLWNQGDGTATVWTVGASGRYLAQQQYGPYAGWTAYSIAAGPDGNTRLLWKNVSGAITLWLLDGSERLLSQHQYGPYAGWSALSVRVAPDNTSRVLWKNADGHIALWTVDAHNALTGQHQFGPYAGWSAQSLGVGPDGNARLLWQSALGQAALWSLTPSGQFASNVQFGPY